MKFRKIQIQMPSLRYSKMEIHLKQTINSVSNLQPNQLNIYIFSHIIANTIIILNIVVIPCLKNEMTILLKISL